MVSERRADKLGVEPKRFHSGRASDTALYQLSYSCSGWLWLFFCVVLACPCFPWAWCRFGRRLACAPLGVFGAVVLGLPGLVVLLLWLPRGAALGRFRM